MVNKLEAPMIKHQISNKSQMENGRNSKRNAPRRFGFCFSNFEFVCDLVLPGHRRRLSQELSKRFPLPDGAVWWAECGSIRWIDSESYYKNATDYVSRQRATRRGFIPP
jgi:hypothetical protein